MNKLHYTLLLLLYCFCFSLFAVAEVGEDTLKKYNRDSVVQKAISDFHNSLGFEYLDKRACDSLNVDGLLEQLEEAGLYDIYFDFDRMLVKSYLFRGEIRMAIAQSDRMYSKALALSNPLGNVLALSALGEVYTYTGRIKEAGEAYERSFEILSGLGGHAIHKRMLLDELINYSIQIKDKNAAAHYIGYINAYPEEQLSIQEQMLRCIANASFQLLVGNLQAVQEYLGKAEKLKGYAISSIQQFLLITEARYAAATGNTEEALATYNQFLGTEYAKVSHNVYKDVMEEKAALLLKTGRKEEAYELYGDIYNYIKTSFEKNYPEEIEQLCTHFQADQLIYQNERVRIVSMRFYIVGIAVCVLLMILFIFLGWKKIFRLRHSQKLQEVMIGKAERAIQRKNMFLSNMSHEVRTPLNAIVGFSAILTDEDETFDDESRKEFCEIIKVNSFQLLKLINDILDFSDFENDNITFHIQSYDAVKLCHETVETVIASHKLEGVEIRFDTDLSVLSLETDDGRLRQVLINLLVNATKFTKQGSIVLKLDMADNDTAFFTVTDTGCGIPMEKQQLIFERFEKLNDFVQGSGLGLSICQLIVKYMNGRLWVDSEYTQGARFCFTHPMKYKPALQENTKS